MKAILSALILAAPLALAGGAVRAGPINGQGTWQATLKPRDLDGNPATIEAWYDTALDITWLAQPAAGFRWADAPAYLADVVDATTGIPGWRLPAMTPAFNTTCNFVYANGTNCGYTMDPASGELAHLYYVTLGNKAYCDPAQSVGNIVCNGPQAGWLNQNTGPFAGIDPSGFWYGDQYAPDTQYVWIFSFGNVDFPDGDEGLQQYNFKSDLREVWPVHSGDIGTPPPDTDGDGITDSLDNCKLVANTNQRDTNGDGYGNLCDPDFNNDGIVNINDFNRLKARLGITPVVDVDTDLDGNGAVNINDLNRLKSYLGKPPGPSGLHPNCPPNCP